MKKLLFLSLFICNWLIAFSQNVGIGTSSPNAKAILEIKSTDKGVLFPRLTTAQRNAITNPPDGLHIFNTDDHCLNYYDSTAATWNCYCDNCKTVVINITGNICRVDFYESFAKQNPAKNYLINIPAGDTISGCNAGDTALSFTSMPFDAKVIINNHGVIEGAGGSGGLGSIEQGCSSFPGYATAGGQGGFAIATKNGIGITVNNYGIIAGGGGGGGGSGANPSGYGGGGGGGAGIIGGDGGLGGGTFQAGAFGSCFLVRIAPTAPTGTTTNGGAGGPGNSGGAPGGAGGNRGQQGQDGTGDLSSNAFGGAAGKAIGGGSGNVLINKSGGQSFGGVD